MPVDNSIIKLKFSRTSTNVLLEFMRILKVLKMYHYDSKRKKKKTNFTDGHVRASFKILVVSDIPISLPNKQVDTYYTYESIRC